MFRITYITYYYRIYCIKLSVLDKHIMNMICLYLRRDHISRAPRRKLNILATATSMFSFTAILLLIDNKNIYNQILLFT